MLMFSTISLTPLGRSHSSIPHAGIVPFKIPLPFLFLDTFSLRLIYSKRGDANALGLADKPSMYLSSFRDGNKADILPELYRRGRIRAVAI